MYCPKCGNYNADDSRFCEGCGQPLAGGQPPSDGGFYVSPEQVQQKVTAGLASVGEMMGLSESEANDFDECFERGKRIVPDIIQPCDQEIPVKQYHVTNHRSRLLWLWAEGRIQVTNKRLLFRASGRSIVGPTVMQTEYSIDEVAGISISKGIRFAVVDFLLALCLLGPLLVALSSLLEVKVLGGSDIGACLLALAAIGVAFVVKKKWFLKYVCLTAGVGFLVSAYSYTKVRSMFGQPDSNTGILVFLIVITAILGIITLILFALKPSVSIFVLTKSGMDGPVVIQSEQHFKLQHAREIIPGADMDSAIREVGALITDIQKLGDLGIQKWQA